jgi:invasion protein IalB
MLNADAGAMWWLVVTLLSATEAGAVAQPRLLMPQSVAGRHMAQAQPLPAQSEAPQRTTATYGDWIVQCEAKNQEPHQKVCEMQQVTQRQVQGKTIPYTLIALGRPAKGQLLKLVVQVPVNVSFSANVLIKTSDADKGILAPFTRCAPGGCFVEFEIKDDMLKKFRAASGTGKISFVDAGGHDISVPLSFNGFSQALDGFLKE